MLCVEGNDHLLQTALINLMDNACKFSYNKKVEIVCAAKGEFVEITIRDQGVGIPQEELEKISFPFHRASNVRQIHGTGIGLPLSVKIIELHSGTCSIESVQDKGTTVKVVLPVVGS